MIIGEVVGPPFDRTIARLSRMVPKLEGAPPGFLLDFCESSVETLVKAADRLEETDKRGAERLRGQAETIAGLVTKSAPKKAKKTEADAG